MRKTYKTSATLCLGLALALLFLTGCNPTLSMNEDDSAMAAKALYASIGIASQSDSANPFLAGDVNTKSFSLLTATTIKDANGGSVTITYDASSDVGENYAAAITGLTWKIEFDNFTVSYTENDTTYEYTLDGSATAKFGMDIFDSGASINWGIYSSDNALIITGEGLNNYLNADLKYSVSVTVTDSQASVAGEFVGIVNDNVIAAGSASATIEFTYTVN